MCLFSGSRRSKLPYSSVLISVWLLGRVSIVLGADVRNRKMKEVMLRRFSRITTRTFWVGA